MKVPWTRLVKRFTSIKHAESWFNNAFLRHHRQAEEIIMDKEGRPLAAVYFTPRALNNMGTKAIFAEIQKRVAEIEWNQPSSDSGGEG